MEGKRVQIDGLNALEIKKRDSLPKFQTEETKPDRFDLYLKFGQLINRLEETQAWCMYRGEHFIGAEVDYLLDRARDLANKTADLINPTRGDKMQLIKHWIMLEAEVNYVLKSVEEARSKCA